MNKLLKTLSVSAIAILTVSFHTEAQSVEEGLKHLDAEQYSASGKIFKQLVQTAPTAENYFYLGYYYLNLPAADIKLDSAKMAFEKGAALDPKKPDPLNRVGLATVKLAQKDRAGAKADFDAITKDTKSKNPDVLFRIGEAYTLFTEPPYDTNDPAEAVRNIELALAKKRDDPKYFIAMADAYLIKNDGGPAMSNLESALALGKDAAKIKTTMGKVWVQGKNYQKALDNYNDAIKTDPNYAPAYRQLGNFYVTYQKYDKAAENFRKYLELADADDAAKLRYVKLAFTAKDYANATRVLDEIKGRIKDPIKYRLEGYSDVELGKPELAVPLIQNFIQNAGKDETGKDRVTGQDYGNIGRAYSQMKDPDKKKMNDSLAIMNMQKAIDMNDTTMNYYPEMAKIYTANKDYKRVADSYRKMIATNKKAGISDSTMLGSALYSDGRISKDTNTLAEAEKIMLRAADVYKEKYPNAAYLAGNSRRMIEGGTPTGRALPAMENYIKYAWADKEKNKRALIDASNYVALISLLVTKDNAKAADYYKKTLELEPTNEDALKGLATATGAPAPTTPTTPPNNQGTAQQPTKN